MKRDLAAGDLERDLHAVTEDGDRNLGAGRALHASDHAVLGEVHAGNDLVIHAQETVSRQHAYPLGRTARDDFKYYGSVVGDIELDPDAVEIAGQVSLGLLQLCRRHIHGMRIKPGERRRNGGIRNLLAIDRIHIHLVDFLKDEIELTPVFVSGSQATVVLRHLLDGKDEQGPEYHAQYGHPYRGYSLLRHRQSTFSTSIPAWRSRSMPSVRRYSSL